MKNFVTRFGAVAGAVGGMAVAVPAFAYDATSTDTVFASFMSAVGQTLTNNLPLILAVVAGLIGLGILIRYVKRHIGRK